MLRSLLFTFLLLNVVDSARILGVFPMPSISHQVVFRALSLELAKRGHELVVITPNPALPKDRPKDNITEIDVGHSYDLMKNLIKEDYGRLKRGVVIDVNGIISQTAIYSMFYLMSDIFNNDEVKQLIDDKNQKFDLVISEAILNFHLIFAKIFDAPAILFSSLYGFSDAFEIIGAPARHPILYPHPLRNKFVNLTLCEKIREIYYEGRLAKSFWYAEEWENALLRSKFGENAPTVSELKDHVSLLFLNSFQIFDNNRPVPPSVIYLGALHLQPVKELPQDLKLYLDNSKRGVVYVSLGTNVRPSMMDEDLLDAFLHAFEALPYDILWKFDGENLKNVPKNVKIQKWFPQRDLLAHPNVKVFVTQGGLQSTDEAIDAGVPLVGIPILGDQWYNVNKYVELGFGVQLDVITLTAGDLVEAVKTVIGDDRFRKNIKRVKTLMYDQPQRPLERAVWWTEHVLRHGGAKHLRAPASNMGWAEYLMVDVLIAVTAVLIVIFFGVLLAFYYIISSLRTSTVFKVKRS